MNPTVDMESAAGRSGCAANSEPAKQSQPLQGEEMRDSYLFEHLERMLPETPVLQECLAELSAEFPTPSGDAAGRAQAAGALRVKSLAALRAEVLAAANEAGSDSTPTGPRKAALAAQGQVPSHYDLRGQEASGVIGLVGALVRSALDLVEKGLQAETPADVRHAQAAHRWIFGPGFDIWVTHAGADPDALRELLMERLPWLQRPEADARRIPMAGDATAIEEP